GYGVLHHCDGNFGLNPYALVLPARDGLLYGTAHAGGSFSLGTIFSLSSDGATNTVLHNFLPASGGDSFGPDAVREAGDGVLYGTASHGGNSGGGTVIRLNKDGSGYGILHNFSSAGPSESMPYGGMAEAPDGALYGVVSAGGTNLF